MIPATFRRGLDQVGSFAAVVAAVWGQEEPIGAVSFGHERGANTRFPPGGLAHGGDHPGGKLTISATYTERGYGWFRLAVHVEKTTYPLCKTCGGIRRLGDRGFCQTITGGW